MKFLQCVRHVDLGWLVTMAFHNWRGIVSILHVYRSHRYFFFIECFMVGICFSLKCFMVGICSILKCLVKVSSLFLEMNDRSESSSFFCLVKVLDMTYDLVSTTWTVTSLEV